MPTPTRLSYSFLEPHLTRFSLVNNRTWLKLLYFSNETTIQRARRIFLGGMSCACALHFVQARSKEGTTLLILIWNLFTFNLVVFWWSEKGFPPQIQTGDPCACSPVSSFLLNWAKLCKGKKANELTHSTGLEIRAKKLVTWALSQVPG
jgi:hypothetical protein